MKNKTVIIYYEEKRGKLMETKSSLNISTGTSSKPSKELSNKKKIKFKQI